MGNPMAKKNPGPVLGAAPYFTPLLRALSFGIGYFLIAIKATAAAPAIRSGAAFDLFFVPSFFI
jgi:hypothetical protein